MERARATYAALSPPSWGAGMMERSSSTRCSTASASATCHGRSPAVHGVAEGSARGLRAGRGGADRAAREVGRGRGLTANLPNAGRAGVVERGGRAERDRKVSSFVHADNARGAGRAAPRERHCHPSSAAAFRVDGASPAAPRFPLLCRRHAARPGTSRSIHGTPMSYQERGFFWRVGHSWYILLTLPLGVTSFLAFGYIGIRAR